jgi:tetratricopeptide (TPR) repeat protein
MMDPYKILGVLPTATDDEIKQAYRALVRKYHPDKYADTDLADMANEKMKEINAAYEEIQQLRKNGASQNTSSQDASHGAYGGDHQSYSGSATFARIRIHINNGELDDALVLLRAVPEADRSGEWHFLIGCVLLRRGHIVDAQNHLDTACRIDPYNSEYRTVRDRLRAQTAAQAGGYRVDTSDNNGCACSACDICMTLACMDCCCDCLCHSH